MSIKAPGNTFIKVKPHNHNPAFCIDTGRWSCAQHRLGYGLPRLAKVFWPYIPPTSVSELPANYKKVYADKRLAKNQKFAKMLDVFGYSDLAMRIRNDRSILVPEEFNSARTWTEYVNRLVGAISGIFLLLCAVYSFSYWKTNKLIVV
jgi:cytochrome c oxidase assembly protein subunit 15